MPGDWAGIAFVSPQEFTPINGGTIQYATIEYAGGGNVNPLEVDRRAAVRVYSAFPTIENVTIRESLTSGLYVWGTSSPYISNNQVVNNHQSGIHIEGIGIQAMAPIMVSNNMIAGNGSANTDAGGGIDINGTPTTIRGNTVTGNAACHGGGIRFSSSGLIENNVIAGNSAPCVPFLESGNGGGIVYTGFETIIRNNVITGNQANNSGGAFYIRLSSPSAGQLTGNLISNNSAKIKGGGLFIVCCSVPDIAANSIVDNTVEQTNQGGGVYCYWETCPITGNNIYHNLSGSPAITPNDFTNGHAAGIPDINAENNYWGTTDQGIIEAQVYHFVDDASLALVDYLPFLNQPIPLTFPSFSVNHSSGAPGSYFTVVGSSFPAGETISVEVNGFSLADVPSGVNGEFTLILSTTSADEGNYQVSGVGYPSASDSFRLQIGETVWDQEGTGPVFELPAGIAVSEHLVFLPTVLTP